MQRKINMNILTILFKYDLIIIIILENKYEVAVLVIITSSILIDNHKISRRVIQILFMVVLGNIAQHCAYIKQDHYRKKIFTHTFSSFLQST